MNTPALVHIGTDGAVVAESRLLERLGQFARQFGRLVLLAFLGRRLLDDVERPLGVLAFRAHVRRTCRNVTYSFIIKLAIRSYRGLYNNRVKRWAEI